MFLLDLEFSRVFYGHDSLSVRNEAGKHIEKGSFSCPCSSRNHDVQPSTHRTLEHPHHRRCQGSIAYKVVAGKRFVAEATD